MTVSLFLADTATRLFEASEQLERQHGSEPEGSVGLRTFQPLTGE